MSAPRMISSKSLRSIARRGGHPSGSPRGGVAIGRSIRQNWEAGIDRLGRSVGGERIIKASMSGKESPRARVVEENIYVVVCDCAF